MLRKSFVSLFICLKTIDSPYLQTMITLTKRLKQETESTTGGKVKKEEVSRVSIRDKLLVKEVQEMEENKPQYCKVKFEDPSSLHDFLIIISPEEGFWQGGRFKFHVKVCSRLTY